MAVGDHLTGGTTGGRKAQTEHNVIQTALDGGQQDFTGDAFRSNSLLVVHTELLLKDAVDEFDFLLLVELHCILALFISLLRIGVSLRGVGLGRVCGVTHNSGRNTQRSAVLHDRIHILSHESFPPSLIIRGVSWGDGSRYEEWGSRP